MQCSIDSVSCYAVSLISDATAMTTFRDRDLRADGHVVRGGSGAGQMVAVAVADKEYCMCNQWHNFISDQLLQICLKPIKVLEK